MLRTPVPPRVGLKGTHSAISVQLHTARGADLHAPTQVLSASVV
jgi:hypothetical protein